MNPRVSKNYAEELYLFIKNEESIEYFVYACSRGVPTIGVGYALAEECGHIFRIRQGIEDDLANIGKHLTLEDTNRLKRICKMLNDGTIKQEITGKYYKDRFDLSITDDQAKKLFELCIPKYDAVIRKKLGPKLYHELQNTKEMVCLFSLAYNAPALIGKGLVDALREGSRAKAQYEILYGSNRNRDWGLDRRRKREAKEFGPYDDEVPTADELKAEEDVRIAKSVQIAKYTGEIEAKSSRKTAKRAKGTGTASLGKEEHPLDGKHRKPGAVTNQQEIGRRIDGAKARAQNQGSNILDFLMERFRTLDKLSHRNWNHHPTGLHEQHYHKRWS